jgi:hypothetical protein
MATSVISWASEASFGITPDDDLFCYISTKMMMTASSSSAVSDRDLSIILANTPAYPDRYTNSAISLHCHVTAAHADTAEKILRHICHHR